MGGGGYQPRREVLAGLGTMGCWVRLGGLTERLPMPQTLTKTHLDGFGGIILEWDTFLFRQVTSMEEKKDLYLLRYASKEATGFL